MSESHFPPEILVDILSRLPPKDLMRLLCVSKAWNAIIRDHRFIKSHLQRSIHTNSARTILLKSYNDPPSDFFSLPFNGDEEFGTVVKIGQPLACHHSYTKIIGCSINGLVCAHNSNRTSIALWNPSIQKSKRIPLPTFEQQQPSSDLTTHTYFGFGYDSANDDYKILGIAEFFTWNNVSVSCQVSVYSLKSNSWKRIQNLPCNGFAMHNSEIVFLNGALSWLMRDKLDNNRCMIRTVDLASDKYQEFDTPVHENGTCAIDLEVLGGSLCISVDDWGCRHYVWIMKEYGVIESWTLLYSIGQDNMPWLFEYCRPLGFSKNGEMVLLKKDDDALVWFDLEGKNVNQVEIGGLPLSFEAIICVGSLSLLDGDPVIVGRQR